MGDAALVNGTLREAQCKLTPLVFLGTECNYKSIPSCFVVVFFNLSSMQFFGSYGTRRQQSGWTERRWLQGTSVAPTCSVEEAPVRCDRCRGQTDWKTNTDKSSSGRSQSSVFNMKCLFFCLHLQPSSLYKPKKKVADTVSIVPSQWLFYAANFLNMLQLASCHWSHQLHICMKHSHSPTKQNKSKKKNKKPSHTITTIYQRGSLSLVLNARLPQSSEDWCTSTGDQHCVAQVSFSFLRITVMTVEVRNPWVNFPIIVWMYLSIFLSI